MRRELVFTAHPGTASPARPVTLAEAGLKERHDLQEWIRAHPTVLGPGIRIVTYEFDRWASLTSSHGDRLDLLGLDEEGRLVLAELKRDGAPATVEMQALKYAAYASRFSPDTLGACHGDYLRRTVDPEITDEDALAQLEEHCGGLDPEQLASPRVVLAAGSFTDSTTATVVWLTEQGLDVSLVQVGAWQCENDLVVTVDQVWPLPQVEDFTVTPVAPIQKAKAPRLTRSRPAVAILADSGTVPDGTELHLVPSGTNRVAVEGWVDARPERALAIWRTGEKVRALEWSIDGQRYAASQLVEHIVTEAGGTPLSEQGPAWWALEDGTTLAELAGTASARRDWSQLHQLLELLQPAEWTTYGDLADAIGSHPIAVGQHITRCDTCQNAWRVLGADGRPRPNFAWSDPAETRTCRQRLEDEGLTFADAGAADRARHVGSTQLSGRVT